MSQKWTRWGRGRRAVAWLAAVAMAVGVLAGLYRGVPVSEVDLNDGGVWVTNKSLMLVAHLNYPSKLLDGGLAAPSESFDIHQAGESVQVSDAANSAVAPIDVANIAAGASATIPATSEVSYGGGLAAVADAKAGKLWIVDGGDIGAFTKADKAVLEKAPGVRAVATQDGQVLAVTSDGAIWRFTKVEGAWTKQEDGRLVGYLAEAKQVLSAVGDQVVSLDLDNSVVRTPKATVSLASVDGVRIQSTGPDSDQVALATPTELLLVPMGGGEPTVIKSPASQAGKPSVPVVFRECVYVAWGASGGYVRDCEKSSDDIATTVPKLAESTDLAFRTNRDVIVLNDVDSGLVFLVNDSMTEVDNWQQVKRQLEKQEKTDTQQTEATDDLAKSTPPTKNTDPVAKDDDFGVRPGRTTWLPVLANDYDQDGDVLTATVGKQPASLGTVQPISSGEALQIAVPEDASGRDTFSYTASDGRGGKAQAKVSLAVHPWSQNAAPKPLRASGVSIVQGGVITYNVLPDWYDPDGDQIYLDTASAAAGTTVESLPDGSVTLRDLGTAEPGVREIRLRVTDGQMSAEGVLRLTVKPGNQNVAPIANSDHVTLVVDQPVIVQPLANDTDPNGDDLRLTEVSDLAGLTVTPDYVGGTVTITSTTVGTKYLQYAISDGKAPAKGVIRVDTIERDTKGAPPAAVPDLALVPANGTTLVDLTLNDTDPMGGVLVVQSLEIDPTAGLSVQLIDHHLARVSAPGGLVGESSFSYTVSNGFGSASAVVKVLPLAPEGTDKPPVAVADAGVVRVGDVVTVDVLANDISPSNLPLQLDQEVTLNGDVAGAVAWTSDNKIRFRAGAKPGEALLTYTVRDPNAGYASATVKITLVGLDQTNQAPKPLPLYARTVAGAKVRIPVPTTGVDPDGDSVTINGLGLTVPRLGSVAPVDGFLEYTPAADQAGTDSFTYTVSDRFGAVGTGVVYVGVAPTPTVNQAPFALQDTVSARPGRLLSVPVVQNDLDPDGDTVHVVPGSVKPVDTTTTIPVSLKDDRINLTTPETAGVLSYYYDITDGRGGTGRGVLVVKVSPTSPLLFPIARDDAVSEQEAGDQEVVTVDVLVNDEDPDGSTDALTVTSTDPGVRVTADHQLAITRTEQRQQIVYTLTDQDNQTAKAVVTVPGLVVPGLKGDPPTIRVEKVPAQVKAGEALTMRLGDYVKVRSGRSPRLTFADSVKAAAGSNGDPLAKDQTTLVFTSTDTFTGPTSITFEVTDGSSADDPDGITAVLTLPIEVLPNPKLQNKPPVFQPSQITVAAGEAATTVDLSAMVTDPDPADQGKLTFSLGEVSQQFKVSIKGSVISVSAPAEAKPGTPGTATVTVKDTENHEVTAAIPLKALSSTRPLISVSPLAINDAAAGKPSVIDLSTAVTNPFAAEGKPVKLVSKPTAANATVAASGLKLTITPAAGYHGQITVPFRLGDATNDPAREVSGSVTVTVRDKPDKPGGVHAESNASKSATVTWAAGPNNGAPITGFEVRWSGADGSTGSQKVGEVTSLTLTNLTNDVWYTFTVVAINEVGPSDPSPASNKVLPDAKPDQVGQPTGTFGDKQVTLTWPTGTTEGAAIAYYTVQVTGGPASVPGQIKGTTVTITGLTNGNSYTFKVVATSKNNLSSVPSSASAPVIPAGAPFQPAAPQVKKDPASNLQPSVTISWAAPNGNGDNAMTYEVKQSSGNTVCSTQSTSCHANIPVSTSNQTFTVRATNKSKKWSPWSGASNAIRPFNPPGAVTNFTLTATGANNTVKFNFSPGALNGVQPSEVTYTWSSSAGGGGTVTPGQTVTSSSGFPNGKNVTVTVTPVARVNGETSQGASANASANAYGPPLRPTVKAKGNVDNVTLSWDASGSANGRQIVSVQIQTTDGTYTKGIKGSINQGNGRGQKKCIKARAQDSTGQWGPWSAQACNTTWANPTFKWYDSGKTIQQVASAAGYTWEVPSNWHVASISLRGYRPNSNVKCRVHNTANVGAWAYTAKVNSQGNADLLTPHVSGGVGYPVFNPATVTVANMGSCTQL